MSAQSFRLLVLSFFSLFSTLAFHGQTGELKYEIAPAKTLVYIDGIEQNQNRGLIELSVGEHRISAWSPNFRGIDTLIQITENKQHLFYYTLRPSQTYREESKAATRKGRSLTYVLLGTGLYTGAYLLPSLNRMKNTKTDAEKLLDLYENTYIGDFDERLILREQYNEKVKSYNSNRSTTLVLSALVNSGTITGVILLRRKKSPQTQSIEENPFAQRLRIYPFADFEGDYGLSITLQL